MATCDIPGAFMQADIDEVLHMRIDGPLVDLLVRVDRSTYAKFVTTEKGRKVIYVQLTKALYGTVQAALMFWLDLSKFLEEKGFVINPYDRCVANQNFDGKQCTIVWHVDDLKISHVDESGVEKVLDMLNERYGKETPITINRGKVHDYLGMTLDYSEAGRVKIRMDDYIERVINEAPDDMSGTAVSPAANHLFDINPDPVHLDAERSELFHHMTAQLLFACKRARPDIQTAVAFLSTRVSRPDEDDYKKLGRCVRYLRKFPKLCLTLEADDLRIIKWWVDASFAVHRDKKSHTGGTMSLGRGSVYSTSRWQKLNTQSSTEAEFVGVDDVMPLVLWTRLFLTEQGYSISDNLVYQDNQSAILLERNGKKSSGRRTRHLDIRYFFVADRIKSGEMKVDYCPTEKMLGDFFTKPLQGAKFREFRRLIMNETDMEPASDAALVPQECVGGH